MNLGKQVLSHMHLQKKIKEKGNQRRALTALRALPSLLGTLFMVALHSGFFPALESCGCSKLRAGDGDSRVALWVSDERFFRLSNGE